MCVCLCVSMSLQAGQRLPCTVINTFYMKNKHIGLKYLVFKQHTDAGLEPTCSPCTQVVSPRPCVCECVYVPLTLLKVLYYRTHTWALSSPLSFCSLSLFRSLSFTHYFHMITQSACFSIFSLLHFSLYVYIYPSVCLYPSAFRSI